MNSDKKMSAYFEARYRKFLLIFKEVDILGPEHEEIKEILSGIDNIKYWCMSDEIDEDGINTQLFILLYDRAVTESYIKGMFPGACVLCCTGSPSEYREFLSDVCTLNDSTASSFEDSDICSVELHSVNFMIFYDIVFLSIFSIFYFCGALGLAQKYLPEDFLLFGFTAGIVFLVGDLIIMGVKLWKLIKVKKLLARLRKKK